MRETSSGETSRVTDLIAESISVDTWNANPDWSPLTENHSPLRGLRAAPTGQRWKFSPRLSSTDNNKQGRNEGSRVNNQRADENLSSPVGIVDIEDIVAAHDSYFTESDQNTGAISALTTNVYAQPVSAVRQAAIGHLSAIARNDTLAGWNACILLAQRDPYAAQPFVTVLARLVADPPQRSSQAVAQNVAENRISANMRAAAAEAWCLVLATAQTDAETAMRLPALVLEDARRGVDSRELITANLPLSVEGELLRGIGRRIEPVRIPGLEATLAKPLNSANQTTGRIPRDETLREASLDACILFAIHSRADEHVQGKEPRERTKLDLRDTQVWPRELWDCDGDADVTIRSRFGLLLALAGDERAFPVLTGQVTDTNREVQQQALLNLGLFGSAAARDKLRDYMTRKSLLRRTALQGLAAFGEQELVRYADNDDAHTREELAKQLTRFQSQESAFALATLLTDPVTSVQQAVLNGLDRWPDELLLPLLLHGAVDGNLRTRTTSLAMLRMRTENVSAPFRADDSADHRRSKALMIARRWKISYPILHARMDLTIAEQRRPNEERIANILSRLSRMDEWGGEGGFESEWFKQLDSSDLAAIEYVLTRCTPKQRNFLFREVLPRLEPEYEALRLLGDDRVEERRTGASQLRKIGHERSLRDPVLRRLAEILVREEDSFVWRDILTAIEPDGTETAADIVRLAVHHRWPDVRTAGCAYVQRHGHREYAIWVQRLFQDPNPTVQLAAIRAAGHCGNQHVLNDVYDEEGQLKTVGLRRLLTKYRGKRHLAVVESMSRLLDPSGLDELNRLSYSDDWKTRVEAINIMADSRQTRFVERLIDVVWLGHDSRPEVQQSALRGLESLIPEEERPTELPSAHTTQEKVSIWHSWWQQRQNQTNRPTIQQADSTRTASID